MLHRDLERIKAMLDMVEDDEEQSTLWEDYSLLCAFQGRNSGF